MLLEPPPPPGYSTLSNSPGADKVRLSVVNNVVTLTKWCVVCYIRYLHSLIRVALSLGDTLPRNLTLA